jgi:hypothetical protein
MHAERINLAEEYTGALKVGRAAGIVFSVKGHEIFSVAFR